MYTSNPQVDNERLSVLVLRMASVALVIGWFLQYAVDFIAIPILVAAVAMSTFPILVKVVTYSVVAAKSMLADARVMVQAARERLRA